MHPTTRTQGPQGAETMLLEIKTADELRDPVLEARWAERREGPQAEVLRYILGAFAERGGPIPVGDIEAALAGRTAAQVRKGLATLDARDLILLEEGEVRLAYPFSATPTPFVEDQVPRSEEHTSELQSPYDLVCRLLLEKKKKKINIKYI